MSISIIFSAVPAQYEKGVLVVKPKNGFKTQFPILSGELELTIQKILEEKIGEFEIEPYLSQNLLEEYIDRNFSSFSLNINSELPDLWNIYRIKFSDNISLDKAITSLNSTNVFDYIEPSYLHEIVVDTVNDPFVIWQYYINTMQAIQAWDYLPEDIDILVGIVDTGIDFEHEDLKEKIWTNSGEIGTDADGNDKKENGIDDDRNGFVDDWRGWDFVSSDEIGEDNDASPGNPHGTHVGGTVAATANNEIGITGVLPQAKLLAVKIGPDDPESRVTKRSYEGVLYAALVGSDIINCSWGGTGNSKAEQEIITAAQEMGSIIVAAAGNSASIGKFYPSAYKNVISVSAINADFVPAWWTNYDYSVDIAAPGVNIFATMPGSKYDGMSGTSMASPIVAAIAGMVKSIYPDYDSKEIVVHLKQTADSLELGEDSRADKLGAGSANALRAVREKPIKGIYLENVVIDNENENMLYELGEEIKISLEFTNVFDDIDDLYIKAYSIQENKPNFEVDLHRIGACASKSRIISDQFVFIIPENLPFDYNLDIKFDFSDGEEFLGSEGITISVNPSYSIINSGIIETTIGSDGTFSYVDFPINRLGNGTRYNQSMNMLYEGALMIGIGDTVVSSAARNSIGSTREYDFLNIFPVEVDSSNSDFYSTKANYFDRKLLDSNDPTLSGFSVEQKTIHPTNDAHFYMIYDVVNQNDISLDSVYIGLYMDWDIGAEGSNNMVEWDYSNQVGLIYNPAVDSLPYIALKLIEPGEYVNFFAMDNDGKTEENPGVYDGFPNSEKWQVMSSGIGRSKSNLTDISAIISAGNFFMLPKDTLRVIFAIAFGDNRNDAIGKINKASNNISEYIDPNIYSDVPNRIPLEISIFPNPAYNQNVTLEIMINKDSQFSIDLVDATGSFVRNIIEEAFYVAGIHQFSINSSSISSGTYYLQIEVNSHKYIRKFVLVK